jgi:ketosteroid isomerase-like protein
MKGDFEAIRDSTDPAVELHEPMGIAGGGTHHGFDETVENVFSTSGTAWEDVSVVPERYVEDSDIVVVLLAWCGTSRTTGTSVNSPNAHVFEFEEGTVVQ